MLRTDGGPDNAVGCCQVIEELGRAGAAHVSIKPLSTPPQADARMAVMRDDRDVQCTPGALVRLAEREGSPCPEIRLASPHNRVEARARLEEAFCPDTGHRKLESAAQIPSRHEMQGTHVMLSSHAVK